MNHFIHILTLTALAATTLSSCDLFGKEPSEPDPVAVLQQQVESERQRRVDAESAAITEAELRRRWETATVVVLLIAVAGFLAGTVLGSRGRHHADATTT